MGEELRYIVKEITAKVEKMAIDYAIPENKDLFL